MAFIQATSFKLSSLALAAAIALGGCGDGKEKKAATQVAAKVNSSEISVHQINAVLAKAPGIPPEAAARVRQEILDKLIDQQLIYDQAVEKRLDRNPEVMMAIEAAKREIVARAYLDQVIAALPKPTDEEIQKYYVANPDLFSRRRVYTLQEITVEPKPEILDDLKQMAATGKSLDDIANWLKEKGVRFQAGGGTRAAEQIPLELLPKLALIKDGQTGVIEGTQSILVVRIASSQAVPVDEADAKPRVQQFLYNQRVQQAASDEIKKLKASAKIERQGEFASTPGESVKPASPTAQAAPPAPVANPIEKGVAGLK
jgi:EpsD family peptidyl-prolyl cis-trans isomerase